MQKYDLIFLRKALNEKSFCVRSVISAIREKLFFICFFINVGGNYDLLKRVGWLMNAFLRIRKGRGNHCQCLSS